MITSSLIRPSKLFILRAASHADRHSLSSGEPQPPTGERHHLVDVAV
jgi:hypothetical protein